MVITMKFLFKVSILIIIIFSFVTLSLTYIITTPKLNKTNYIEIYDNNNNLIYTELYGYESNYIHLDSLNSYTYNAFIAIEDEDFYKHNGFNISRNIQALLKNFFSLSIKEGASTITQQYARNTLLSTEKTLSRKIKEAFYTIQIERKYSKKKILEGYLNSLYFGHGLTGIDAASNYYFGKTANNLTVAESAMLAAICNAPSIYSPKINITNANNRKSLVLYKMLIQNYITKAQYQTALKEKINYNFNKIDNSNFYYYKNAVIDELKKLNIYNKKNLQKGIKVYTNIDYELNNKINSLLEKYTPLNKDIQTSIVIMEPQTSKVIYISGGFNYNESFYNRAINSSRQIGSTIKPLLYSLALNNGFSPTTLLKSEETNFNIDNIGTYSPKNANNKYANSEIDMIQAIALSDNIYALKTLLLLGSENLVNLLKLFDIQNVEALPSIALGTVSMSLLELTAIYNTFASLGKYYKPSFISKVSDINNKTLHINKSHGKQILNTSNTLILNQMLTSTFDSSLTSYATPTMVNYKTNHIYAAKSGTTNSDSYVMAYNPNYTIGIWVGSDSNNKLPNYTLPKQLFKEINNILEEKKDSSWYKTNYQTIAKRYNPNTHSFDTNGNLYYFNKDRL